MHLTRRLSALMVAAASALTVSVAAAPAALAACAPGTYPPSSCPPVVALNGPTAAFTLTATTTVSYTATSFGAPISYYQVRVGKAAWNGGWGSWIYPSYWQHLTATSVVANVPIGNTLCFEARAVDSAGRVSAWTHFRCTARPLDDRAMTASGSWTRGGASGYYANTYSRATAFGASLTLSGAQLARVALIATHCPGCGTVAVYVGSTKVGTVSLASSTSQLRVVSSFGPFSLRTATVSFRVVSSGKPVYVDAVGISRI